MKKVLASVLAAAMVLGTASVAFAANNVISKTKKGSYAYSLVVDKDSDNATYETGAPYLVTYGPDDAGTDVEDAGNEAEIVIEPDGDLRITDIDVHVNTKNVTAKVKKNDGLTYTDKNGKEYKSPVLTLKGNAGLRTFEFEDYEVEVDLTIGDADKTGGLLAKGASAEKDITITVKLDEGVAYSRIQEFEEDTNYTNSKTNGVVYNFDEVIGDESRIRANDYVDVYFKGNYGTDYENMRLVDDDIDEIVDFFGDVDVDCYDFIANPKFASKVKVIIDADSGSVLYEYNKKTGDVTKVDAEYESDGWAFETKVLGTYIVAEEEYEEGTISKDGETSSDEETEEPTDGDKTNPGTGANDMVGAAAAMAVVSLVAAGAVAFKKASK
ncbi:acid shock protein [Harryflintia acetispora]|uniref:Gram-positive cocci surface proteins LPxTG domain-containing protein n=1 Tax=Harryflintia acetispora TaxID=1849041 RepID=A0A9X8UKF9_9FIRM|nr:acid shock protein [Harryflintia acetispora]TCL44515.1 hypothetical protein EDD78_102134 [Harryflintia acetispora]